MDEKLIYALVSLGIGALIGLVLRKSDQTTENSTLLSQKLTLSGVHQNTEDLKQRVVKIEDKVSDLEKIIPVVLEKISHIEREVETGQKAIMIRLGTLEGNQEKMMPTVNKALDYFTTYHKQMTDLFNSAIQQMKDAVKKMEK